MLEYLFSGKLKFCNFLQCSLEWQMRACYKAVEWYYEHLGGQKPLIIVTQDESLVRVYEHKVT